MLLTLRVQCMDREQMKGGEVSSKFWETVLMGKNNIAVVLRSSEAMWRDSYMRKYPDLFGSYSIKPLSKEPQKHMDSSFPVLAACDSHWLKWHHQSIKIRFGAN